MCKGSTMLRSRMLWSSLLLYVQIQKQLMPQSLLITSQSLPSCSFHGLRPWTPTHRISPSLILGSHPEYSSEGWWLPHTLTTVLHYFSNSYRVCY